MMNARLKGKFRSDSLNPTTKVQLKNDLIPLVPRCSAAAAGGGDDLRGLGIEPIALVRPSIRPSAHHQQHCCYRLYTAIIINHWIKIISSAAVQ